MKTLSVADVLAMPVQERIRLVEIIWDSIAVVPELIEITPEVRSELELRLREFEANPEAGFSWERVKENLRSGAWSTA